MSTHPFSSAWHSSALARPPENFARARPAAHFVPPFGQPGASTSPIKSAEQNGARRDVYKVDRPMPPSSEERQSPGSHWRHRNTWVDKLKLAICCANAPVVLVARLQRHELRLRIHGQLPAGTGCPCLGGARQEIQVRRHHQERRAVEGNSSPVLTASTVKPESIQHFDAGLKVTCQPGFREIRGPGSGQ